MTPEKALNIIAGICSKKEYCCRDVQDKLVKWEIAENEISGIMDFLYQHNFVNDNRFAQAYAEDKFRFNHWGKQKIRLMLRQKGIKQEIIEEALSILDNENYDEACTTLLTQKLKTLHDSDPYKIKAKLIRFGLGRGFDFDTLERCLSQMLLP